MRGIFFKVITGDVPYQVYGRDCSEIVNKIGRETILARNKRFSGELVGFETDTKQEAYDILRTIPPKKEGQRIKFGEIDAEDLNPRISGVVVRDPNIAHTVAELFERRDYELIKKYS